MTQPIVYDFRNVLEVQQRLAPKTYENIDLSRRPERFRTELGVNSKMLRNTRVRRMLADPERVEFFRQLTLMGDPVADACATMFPEMGFGAARQMLDRALEHGIDAVPEAPASLRRFMATIEHVPSWVDFDKIDYATRRTRLGNALFDPVVTRAAFMLTYVNGYQGLPMLITGALAGKAASRRIRETTSTLRLAVLPGALHRDGEAFKSAAKVRIMHAMVRYNLLHKSELWDPTVYGVPIPQVDQMGAALSPVYMLAKRALAHERRFTPLEQGVVELSRYLAYLLGLHFQFLSDDPREIVDTWQMVQATLPHKFDPRSQKLNAATLNAYLQRDERPTDRVVHALDQRASRVVYRFLVGQKTAEMMDLAPRPEDWLAAAAWGLPLITQWSALTLLRGLPGMDERVDRYAIAKIRGQLQLDVNPVAYKTDAAQYQQAV